MFSTGYITFALIAVVIFTIYMSVLHIIFYTSKLKNRIKDAAAGYTQENAEEAPPAFALFCEWAVGRMKIDPARKKELTMWLSRAGLDSPYAISYYLFFSRFGQPLILIVSIVVMLPLFHSNGVLDALLYLIITFCFVIAGLRGARLYVENLRQKRMEALTASFPEMLDLLLVCIESGLGLDAALNRVCKELRDVHPVVVSELDRMRLELTMLNDRSQALQNMAERLELVPFKTLVAALIQTEKFGTSLTDTLRVLSEEQRLARLYGAEQKAARIPVLITLPLILFIMPAFLMIILGPPVVKVINNGGLFGGAIIVPKK